MALTVTTNQTIAAAGNAHIRDRMHILAPNSVSPWPRSMPIAPILSARLSP